MTSAIGAVAGLDFGPRAWTPAWIVLYLLAGLVVLIVVSVLGGVLVWLLAGRSRRARTPADGAGTGPDGIPGGAPSPSDQR